MISVDGGVSTWDWQIKKWFSRIYGIDMFFDTLDEMQAIVILTDDNIADLQNYKQHCEELNGGSN